MKKNWPIIILISIAIALCFQNYTPGTILSGWDTLHPEFNFWLNIKREIFGVFRSYQGLGAVAAHSDMADLPRIIVLAILNFFLPLDFLRYSYIFLNLILGPIGMYCFLRYILVIPNPTSSDEKSHGDLSQASPDRDDRGKIPSFLGALFYLLNLGTMQQFIVPLEMFTTQYAILPWLFLIATYYIYNKRHQKRTLLLFSLATILGAPQAYSATLWYIYFISLTLFILSLTFAGALKKDFSLIKKALTLIILTILLNSFWILPNIYYIINHAREVTQANINKLFSPQAFLYNKEFGNIKDILLLKSFLFDWKVYSNNNEFVQLLAPWITHLKQPFVQLLGFLFAGISFTGIAYGILKRNKILISLLPLLFLCLFFLFNENFPTSPLYTFLTDKIPFFREAFRFPQDKVFGIFTFLFAIYFAAGQLLIIRLYKRIKYAQIIIFAILLLYFMLPAFKGNFISPYMRIKIPEYYFEMFSWLNKEEEGRMANLPINSLWGWEYYNWYKNKSPSFQGAGFIWFGIKQPILSRDFDRWSPYNEQYYREMSYAIYSQNPEALKLVLEKYNIKYILLDKSIIAPQNNPKVLLYKETQRLLGEQDYIQKIKEFDNTLIVYKVNPAPTTLPCTDSVLGLRSGHSGCGVKTKTPDTAYIVQNLPYIFSDPQVFYEDAAYKDYGNYMVEKGNVYYPLANLIDSQSKVLPNVLKLTQEGVVIRLSKEETANFILPSYINTQESIASDLLVEKIDNKLNITFYPRFPVREIKNHPTPIFVKAELPKTESIILSINKKDNFILNTSVSNTPLSLGVIFLTTKSDNTIAIYPSIPNEEMLPDLSTIKYYVEPCENMGDEKIFGGYRTVPSFGIEKAQDNSFNIFGKNTHLCMTIPLSEVINKDLKYSEVLLNVTFNYKSNLPLRFCLVQLINGSCQNYKSNSLLEYFGAHQTVHPFGIHEQDIQDLGLQFQLDTTNSNNIEKAFYSNLTLSLTYPFSTEKLSLRHSGNQALPEHPESLTTIGDSGQTRVMLTLPFSGNQQLSVDITKLPKTSGFCPNSPFSNSPLIKKQILEDNKDHFIRYKSIDGVSCDHFSYQNLSQNEAYLIAITSRNLKGLPLTLCITNQVSKHCDIYASLSTSSDFTTDIFLLPPQIENENGFDVNIGNLGIKKTPSFNDLKSIEIIPFPYKWLTHIKALNEDPKQTSGSVLVLPQSFEKGWRAYRIKNYELGIMNWVNTTFPFIFGEELKTHVLVNSWENGWTIDSSKFVIVFLPQYLEYLGFILLAGTCVYLAFLIKKTS